MGCVTLRGLIRIGGICRSRYLWYFYVTHLWRFKDTHYIMLLPMKKEEAVGLFNLINQLHENVPIIITTNKAPTEWAKNLVDEVLATALLDRLLYQCEVLNLSGTSYRMETEK